MKHFILRKSLPILAVLCLIISTLSFTVAYAAAAETESIPHIYDKAELLSTSEVDELEAMCTDYGTEAGIEIMILTHNDSNAVDAETYIEDFEDQLPVGDRVYILIDMANRKVFMEGYGLAETYIHSNRIDAIISEITPSLSGGDYYDAFVTYIKRSAAYMTDDSEVNYNHDYNSSGYTSSEYNSSNDTVNNVLKSVWFQLLIAVIIGAVAVVIMAFNSGGKMTVGGNNYIDQNHSGLIGRRDDYVRTQVTRIRKPQNNNQGGGFRGGFSGGGRSHSSGGGSF